MFVALAGVPNGVEVYPPGSTAQIAILRPVPWNCGGGSGNDISIAFAPDGTLYMMNRETFYTPCPNGTIMVYGKEDVFPMQTISNGVDDPRAIAVSP
ncbi:MAG: hypothetical protein JO277_10360 [Candidatus Eremiobacteraeota bacterium]|nr:hypothetical protein [Candidatus Eremiobacteraeota bacterium]